MQAFLDKIFQDKTKSTDSKRSVLQSLLSNIKSNSTKGDLIKSAISSLLPLEETHERIFLLNFLVNQIIEMEYECYKIEEIKDIIETNEELVILALFTNLVLKLTKDRHKILQMKSIFLKYIKKEEHYWYVDVIKEFFEYKVLLENQANQIKLNNKPTLALPQNPLASFQYDKHLLQVSIVYSFFSENPSFYPPNFDSKEVLLKWFLTIRSRTEPEKQLQARMIEQLLNLCRTNYQFYVTSFSTFIKAIRFTYTEADAFECQKSFYDFLEQTDPKAIDELMKPLIIGPSLNAQEWVKVFRNLLKSGLSDNVGIAFLSLAKGFENIKAFEVLLTVQEEIIPNMIFPLKVEKWQNSTLCILCYFILKGPINANIMPRMYGKLFATARDVCRNNLTQFSTDLISFLYHVKVKYAQSSLSEEIEQEYGKFIQDCQVDPIRIDTQRYSIVPWTILENVQQIAGGQQQQKKSKFKGLKNLGNTCYMNSFIQALYMTKLFRYRVLSLGEVMSKLAKISEVKEVKDNKDNEESKTTAETGLATERKKAMGVVMLQKLFAMMYSSERDAISPQFLKYTLPGHFKTSHSQEDSSEFGRIYLDDLEKNLTNTEEKEMVKEMFTGEIVSYITCQECKTQYRKVENFMDLSLNFESRDPTITYDLPNLIHKNFEPIEFKENNKYYCETCQKHSELAIKRHIPTRIPPILILTINRFYFDTQTFQRVKILSHIDILDELVMTQEKESEGGVQEEIIYDLYAIVVHRGMTLDFGHYYCAAKENVTDPNWFLFDDSNTVDLDKLDPFEYVKKNQQDAPYILFYQARDYFNKSAGKFADFKLSNSLRKMVEQDNVANLKEVDHNAKLLATIAALNIPKNLMTGPARGFKKDDDEEDDPSQMDLNTSNKFIM